MDKKEDKSGSAVIRDVILGGQDGLVNVLGIVLAVATATNSKYIIFISGMAATFAESISMAAVAYTSAKAGQEFYAKKDAEISQKAMSKSPEAKAAVREILSQKCMMQGTMLNKAVQYVMADRTRLRNVWMNHADGSKEEFEHPVRDALVVGFSAIIGSLIPLIPFVVLPISTAFWTTIGFSSLALFASGAMKANYTGVSHFKSAVEMMLVGMTAAIAGYLIGVALGAMPIG